MLALPGLCLPAPQQAPPQRTPYREMSLASPLAIFHHSVLPSPSRFPGTPLCLSSRYCARAAACLTMASRPISAKLFRQRQHPRPGLPSPASGCSPATPDSSLNEPGNGLPLYPQPASHHYSEASRLRLLLIPHPGLDQGGSDV